MVQGGDPCFSGREFEDLLDGHFSHKFVLKIKMFVWQGTKK